MLFKPPVIELFLFKCKYCGHLRKWLIQALCHPWATCTIENAILQIATIPMTYHTPQKEPKRKSFILYGVRPPTMLTKPYTSAVYACSQLLVNRLNPVSVRLRLLLLLLDPFFLIVVMLDYDNVLTLQLDNS